MTKQNPVSNYRPQEAKVKAAQNALTLAGGVIKDAVDASGISKSTFQRYINAGFIDPSIKLEGADNLEALGQYAADRNAKLAESMMGTAEKAVDQVNANLFSASAKDAALIAGIMIDKSQLLNGQPTKRVAVDINGSLEILKRHGVLVEDDSEVIDAELVAEIEA